MSASPTRLPNASPAPVGPADPFAPMTVEQLQVRLAPISAGVSTCLYDTETVARMVPVVNEIRRLKQEKDAVILAHTYASSEILYGVADSVGDSYGLSKFASTTTAGTIVFAAVRFMAETAKIINPGKQVLIPGTDPACSLADSIDAEQVRALRRQYPDHAFVCYINTTAAVKAECDVCVTSGNVYKIIERLPQEKIVFLPDRLMGANIRAEMARRGVRKELVLTSGACHVHEEYDEEMIDYLRLRNPGLQVAVHPECAPGIALQADYVGSTEQLLSHISQSSAPKWLLMTECGLSARLQSEFPGKIFVGSCAMCRYMKSNSLEGILRVLREPRPDDAVRLDPEIALRARRCIDKMFELTEA